MLPLVIIVPVSLPKRKVDKTYQDVIKVKALQFLVSWDLKIANELHEVDFELLLKENAT